MKTEDPTCSWDVVTEALKGKHHKNAVKARYKELQSTAETGAKAKENDNSKDKKEETDKPLDKMTKKERRAAKVKADDSKKQQDGNQSKSEDKPAEPANTKVC